MDEKLTSIVQRMIAAGEPEENIALVIKNYDSNVKKKDISGQDSKTLGTPSSSSGSTDKVADGSSLIAAIEEGKKSEVKEPEDKTKKVADYDSVKSNAIVTLKDIYKKIDESDGSIENYRDQIPGTVEGGINVMPSDNTFIEANNPEFIELNKQGSAVIENARKAFKVDFFEKNPDLVKDLESEDEEVSRKANNKLIEAWVKEPESLSGSERNMNEMSGLEKTYHYFKEGMEERDFNLRMANEIFNASDEEAKKLLELEYERAMSEGADINFNEPELTSAEGISKMVGTQVMPIVTTTAIGVIPGLQPAAIAYSSADAAATAYGASFRSSYIQARNQKMTPEEAYNLAQDQSKIESTVGGVEGFFGAFTGGFATKAGGKLAEKFGSKMLKPLINKAVEGTTDMGLDASAAMVGQMVNNWTAKSKGLDVGLFDGVADEMLGEIIFSAGMKVPNTVKTVGEYKNYINSLPPIEQQKIFDEVVDSKDRIDQKVLKEKITGYLDVKSKEAEASGDNVLSEKIKKDPKSYLETEKKRLETISSSLKNDAAKKEVNENIEALDMMLKSLPEYKIKSGNEESALTKNEMMDKLNDPEFLEAVTQGDIDLTISNDNEAMDLLQEKINEKTSDGDYVKPGNRLFNEPNQETIEISKEYRTDKGIEVEDGEIITELDEENSKKIADAYEEMKHEPDNPEVIEAYNAMAQETVDQYNKINEKGYKFEIYEGEGEPYKNSKEMIDDIKNNNHLYILSTSKEFGDSKITDEQRKENPLLGDSDIKDINGVPLLVNDVFRGVHDFFGHSERGNSFGAIGEENAWDVHARMYSPKARRAMTTETRGQNSWVNFGPQMRNEDGSIKKKGDEGYLSPTERKFAEQKIGLLPVEYSEIISSKKGGTDISIDDTVVNTHKENGGSSISQDGENLYGKKGFAVSAFPERTVAIKGKEITAEQVKEFKEKNKDLLEDKNNFTGTWYDKDSGQSYIDISNRQKTFKQAEKIAKKYNQKAIFDLETGKEISTGGTGEAKPSKKDKPSKKTKIQKDIEKETGVTKPVTWVKMTEKSALKEKIKNLARGYREGSKIAKDNLKEVQTELIKYIENSFNDLDISKATERQARYMIRNVTPKNIDSLIDRVDAKVEKAMIVKKKQVLTDIIKTVSDKKSILKKKGNKWVGRVPVNVQEYIQNFSMESLNGMNAKELNDVKESLNNILKEGVKETKALERARNAQKRIDKAEAFEAFFDGETVIADTDVKELSETLTDPDKVALIGSQLIESKSALDEYLKDNPEASLGGVKLFERKSKQVAKFNEDRNSKSILRSVVKFLDPTRRKANLRNHLSHFAKAGKKGRLLADKIYASVVKADNDRNKSIYTKKKEYADSVSNIFGKKTNAYRRLSQNAKIQPHGEMTATPSNGQAVHWYNMYQTKDGKGKIDGDKKFDMDIVNEYMNDPANADLKAYADYLLNDFYVELKSEYEPTYTHITGTKFPEGTYYPLFSTTIDGDVHDVTSIMDKNGNINYKTAVSGNLKQRVKHTNPLDYTRDAHEVALNYISTMERAKHFIPVGELVNSTFNKSATPEIINLIGSGDMIDLTDHLTATISGQSPRKQSVRDSKFVNTVQGIRVFGALAFKLSSIPKQLTSAGRFTSADDITLKEWFKGFAPVNKEELEVMSKIASSDYVKERFKGESIDIEANRLLNPKRGAKASGFLSKATRAGMVTTSIGDIGGVLSGGSPYALAIYRKGIKDGLTSEEAYEKAYKRFVEVSEETQQSTAIHETSHMQRDNIGRLFSSFTTSQTQGANKLIHSTRMLMSGSDLTASEKKNHAYNIAYYAGENMFFSIVASGFLKEMLTSDFSDEDDIEGLKKGTYDTVMDNMSSILSGLDYWGYLANYAVNHSRGDDWKNELPVIQEMQRLAYGSSSLSVYLSSGGDWDSLTDAEKKDIEKMLPVDAIIKQFDDWKKYREGDKGFIDALMGYKTAQEKKQYKKVDKIYEGIFGEPYKKSSGRQSRSTNRKSERTSR